MGVVWVFLAHEPHLFSGARAKLSWQNMMPLWKLLLTETRQIIWQIWHHFADFIQGKEMSSNDVRTLCGRTVAQKSSRGVLQKPIVGMNSGRNTPFNLTNDSVHVAACSLSHDHHLALF
jgi:hypothetical protein